MPGRAVLFDFDGTLADSFAAITASTNAVRASYGLPPLPESEIRIFVGLGLEHLLAQLVRGAPPAEAVARYREHHPSVMATHTHLFPGVRETLVELRRRGYALAVCSNKTVHFTKQLVKDLGLGELFAEVLGPEDVPAAKPDPAMLLEACRRLKVSAADAVYIGDMAIDVRAAQAAGMPVWLVAGGAAGSESAEACGPDRVLAAFADMLPLLPTDQSNLTPPPPSLGGKGEPESWVCSPLPVGEGPGAGLCLHVHTHTLTPRRNFPPEVQPPRFLARPVANRRFLRPRVL